MATRNKVARGLDITRRYPKKEDDDDDDAETLRMFECEEEKEYLKVGCLFLVDCMLLPPPPLQGTTSYLHLHTQSPPTQFATPSSTNSLRHAAPMRSLLSSSGSILTHLLLRLSTTLINHLSLCMLLLLLLLLLNSPHLLRYNLLSLLLLLGRIRSRIRRCLLRLLLLLRRARRHIQTLINRLRDRLNLCPQLLLNPV